MNIKVNIYRVIVFTIEENKKSLQVKTSERTARTRFSIGQRNFANAIRIGWWIGRHNFSAKTLHQGLDLLAGLNEAIATPTES